MVISLSACLSVIANWVRASGIAGKVVGWISTLGISSLLVYGFWFGGTIKKVLHGLVTVMVVWIALTFLSQAGLLPAWVPISFVW